MTFGDIEAKQLIQEACDLVDRVEPRLRALVAEPERRRRLVAEAEGQDPTLRPFLVGVKDLDTSADRPWAAKILAMPDDPDTRLATLEKKARREAKKA